jgi:hypothetical protein
MKKLFLLSLFLFLPGCISVSYNLTNSSGNTFTTSSNLPVSTTLTIPEKVITDSLAGSMTGGLSTLIPTIK